MPVETPARLRPPVNQPSLPRLADHRRKVDGGPRRYINHLDRARFTIDITTMASDASLTAKREKQRLKKDLLQDLLTGEVRVDVEEAENAVEEAKENAEAMAK